MMCYTCICVRVLITMNTLHINIYVGSKWSGGFMCQAVAPALECCTATNASQNSILELPNKMREAQG